MQKIYKCIDKCFPRRYGARMARSRPSRNRSSSLLDAWVNPRFFDFWASRLNRLWSWQRPLARVVSCERIGPDAVTLALRRNRHCGPVLPGQHVNVGAEIDGRMVTRCYSPTCHADGTLSISVKAIDGGRLSRHLCDVVRPGDVVELGAGFGEMTLPRTTAEPWLFLAAGSGITPMASLLRDLAARDMPATVDLMYWARSEADLWFADELRGMAAKFPSFRLHLFTTRDVPAREDVAHGRIAAPVLEQRLDEMPNRHVYACGPAGFVDAARALLAGSVASFDAEAFSMPEAPLAEEGEVQVHLAKRGLTLSLPRAATLLSALEAAGLRPASGCRMGICHTCACGKRSGATHDLLTGETASEPVSSLRLCVSRPASDLVLDL